MPRRAAPSTPPQRPVLTVGQKSQVVARLERRIAELDAFDPSTVSRRFTDPDVQALETAIDEALSAAFGHGTVEYERYRRATQLDHGAVFMQVDPMFGGGRHHRADAQEAQEHVVRGKAEALALLKQAVKSLKEEIEEHEPPSLGRGRTCLLRKGDVEIPSDLFGVIYTELDAADGWKLKLVRELKAAGLKFDANKALE